MMMNNTDRFNHAVNIVLKHEGRLSLDKYDPGGATNYGISLRYLKMMGIDINLDGKIDITDILSLNRDKAIDIYYRNWWLPNRYNEIYELPLATKVFDLAVNMGHWKANKLFQDALNRIRLSFKDIPLLKIDGIIGQKTINACNNLSLRGETGNIITSFRSNAIKFYNELVHQKPRLKRYYNGWLNRVKD